MFNIIFSRLSLHTRLIMRYHNQRLPSSLVSFRLARWLVGFSSAMSRITDVSIECTYTNQHF